MGRPRTTQLTLIAIVALILPLSSPRAIPAAENPAALKFVVSLEQPVIVEPQPARVSLHLLNSGQTPQWLYRRAQPPETGSLLPDEEGAARSFGGATVGVHLEPADSAAAKQVVTPARGRILVWTGLPHPKLVKVGSSDSK